MNNRQKTLILLVISAAGLLLWSINFFHGRALFLDELNVARNVFDRGFGELFSPLDHRQYASPLWLVTVKFCGELFGYRETALRLPSFVFGLSAFGFWWATLRRLDSKLLTALGLALLFVNPTLLRYSGELKPYVADLAVSMGLLWYAGRTLHPGRGWLLLGVLLPWLSLPSVFCLTAVGLYGFYNTREKRWPLYWVAWLVSFALLCALVIVPSLGDPVLTAYHGRYFLSVPRNLNDFLELNFALLSQLRLTYGFTLYAAIIGAVFTMIGLFRRPELYKEALFLPVLLAALVSFFHLYSLLPRLMLFSLPCWWFPALLGTRELRLYLQNRSIDVNRAQLILVVVWLPVLLSTNVFRHFTQPVRTSDARKLVTDIPEDYLIIPKNYATPAVDYYTRIHPDFRREQLPTDSSKSVYLFDVLTSKSSRQGMARTQGQWNREVPCGVRADTLFRAGRVFVDCGGAKSE